MKSTLKTSTKRAPKTSRRWATRLAARTGCWRSSCRPGSSTNRRQLKHWPCYRAPCSSPTVWIIVWTTLPVWRSTLRWDSASFSPPRPSRNLKICSPLSFPCSPFTLKRSVSSQVSVTVQLWAQTRICFRSFAQSLSTLFWWTGTSSVANISQPAFSVLTMFSIVFGKIFRSSENHNMQILLSQQSYCGLSAN